MHYLPTNHSEKKKKKKRKPNKGHFKHFMILIFTMLRKTRTQVWILRSKAKIPSGISELSELSSIFNFQLTEYKLKPEPDPQGWWRKIKKNNNQKTVDTNINTCPDSYLWYVASQCPRLSVGRCSRCHGLVSPQECQVLEPQRGLTLADLCWWMVLWGYCLPGK